MKRRKRVVKGGYFLSTAVGAVLGGVAVAALSKVNPKSVEKIAGRMKENKNKLAEFFKKIVKKCCRSKQESE